MRNKKYINRKPKCEPFLSKYGLCRALGSQKNFEENRRAIMWVLNFSDGNNTLIDISERSGIDIERIKSATRQLIEHNLLDGKEEVDFYTKVMMFNKSLTMR